MKHKLAVYVTVVISKIKISNASYRFSRIQNIQNTKSLFWRHPRSATTNKPRQTEEGRRGVQKKTHKIWQQWGDKNKLGTAPFPTTELEEKRLTAIWGLLSEKTASQSHWTTLPPSLFCNSIQATSPHGSGMSNRHPSWPHCCFMVQPTAGDQPFLPSEDETEVQHSLLPGFLHSWSPSLQEKKVPLATEEVGEAAGVHQYLLQQPQCICL